jgi:hypothetical protein
MSYSFYLVVHLAAVFAVLMALAGRIVDRTYNKEKRAGWARSLGMLHGIALILVLVAGFGMLAKGGYAFPWPGWVWVKLGIWVLIGGSAALIARKPRAARSLWWGVWLLAALAAFMAQYKPF